MIRKINHKVFKYIKNTNRKKSIALLVISICAFIFRMAIPHLKIFLIGAILLLIIDVIIQRNFFNLSKRLFIISIKVYIPVILLYFSFLVGVLLTSEKHCLPVSDIFNASVGLIIISFLFIIVTDKIQWNYFYKLLLKSFFIFSCISLFLGYVKFVLSIFGIKIYELFYYERSFSMSLVSDYNFYSLAVLIGVIISIYWLINNNFSKKNKVLLAFYWLLAFFCLILTGSRRAIVIFLIFEIFSVFYLVFLLINNNKQKGRNLIKPFSLLIGLQFILLILSSFFVICLSDRTKDYIIRNAGGNQKEIKLSTTYQLARIVNLVYPVSVGNFNDFLWHQERIDNDLLNSNFIKKIKSFNERIIIPSNNSLVYNGNFKKGITNWNKWGNSIFYLGKKNNSEAILHVQSTSRFNGVKGNFFASKDSTVYFSAVISVLKHSSNLRVILKSSMPVEYKTFRVPKEWEADNIWHEVNFKYTPKISQNIIFIVSGGDTLKSSEVLIKEVKASYQCLLSNKLKIYNPSNYLFKEIKGGDKDKNKVPKLTLPITPRKNLFSSRKVKMVYALTLFKEKKLVKKIIGNGFDYRSEFGEKFYKNNKRYDYPHNPLLSSLLYSGVLGFIFTVFLFLFSFFFYIKNYRVMKIWLFLFLLVSFFSFFSGNSIFSVPFFIFLLFLPFHYNVLNISSNKII